MSDARTLTLAEITALAPKQRSLRAAVRAAIVAYEKSGCMVDAALEYARHGFPVFPVSAGDKRPIPPRLRDPETDERIPRTGGVYRATCDPIQIRKWWKDNPKALIAMPMGGRTGIWCLDVDTPEDHADGTSGWNALIAQHELIDTREHRSATDGPHLIFNWHEEQPFGCSKGSLPHGIEVKGQGGYIVVPPSQRRGRSYTIFKDIDPIDAPQWLVDLVLQGRPLRTAQRRRVRTAQRRVLGRPLRTPQSTTQRRRLRTTQRRRLRTTPWPEDGGDVDIDELTEAMEFVPNDDLDWDDWTAHGLALFAATGGSKKGFELFDALSQQSNKYDADTTRARWQEIRSSPPDRTGAGKLLKIAREHGWVPGLKPHPPSYPSEGGPLSDQTRDEIRRVVRRFLDSLLNPKKYRDDAADMEFYDFWIANGGDDDEIPWPPLVWAMKVVTGGGKTSIMVEEIARWLKVNVHMTPLIFAVPHHKLGAEVVKQFIKLGIDARQFRGYMAPDPGNPLNIEKWKLNPDTPDDELDLAPMCWMPDRVGLAAKTRSQIAASCCKKGKNKCPYYDGDGGEAVCPYRQQYPAEGDEPQVWVVASDILFHTHVLFKHAKAVIVDESFWQKGLRGLPRKKGDEEDADECVVPLAVLKEARVENEVSRDYRERLVKALEAQIYNGGVRCRYLADELDRDDCRHAINAEWEEARLQLKRLGLEPGMSAMRFQRAKEKRAVIEAVRRARLMVDIWKEIQLQLSTSGNGYKGSGRLRLDEQDGLRLLRWRGIEPIHKPYSKLPTLLIDAVLPDKKILRRFYPQVEVVAEINACASPHTHARQVTGGPYTANKLDVASNLEAAWRYIMQEWLLAGRCDTLVIAQKKVVRWLRKRGLPDNVHTLHYYALSGIDKYKAVGLGILLGRPSPGPRDIEAIAGALSRVQQEACIRVRTALSGTSTSSAASACQTVTASG